MNFMEDMDISALFGNILDNAIESVQKLNEQEKRLIHLSVAKQKQFLRIRCENYCEEQLKFENGIPVTTKNANYAQTECQFRYCGTAIPFLTVRSTAR